MKKRKQIFALAMSVVMLFSMSGCSASQTTVESAMKPPTLSKDQEEIYDALRTEENQTFNLVYPESGEYLSAYVIENFDEEETEEALAFYKDASSAASPIKINVLDKDEEGKWDSVWVESVVEPDEGDSVTLVKATEIVKVSFLKSNGQTYVVIGFRITSVTSDNLQVRVYKYADKRLTYLTSLECAEYAVYDLDRDSHDEIVTISTTAVSENKEQMIGRFYEVEADTLSLKSGAPLSNNVSAYTGIYNGKLANGTPALYVDYNYGSEAFTDILITEKQQLKNIIQQNGEDNSLNTRRIAGLSCEDVEYNGVYCIPQNMAFPGYDKNTLYYVDWMKYIDGTMQQVKHAYVDYNCGYYFTLPEKWIGTVTLKRDLANNEITFFRYQGDLNEDTDQLLKIKVFSSSELVEEKLPAGYEWLSRNGQLIYGFQLSACSDVTLNLEEATVISNFSRLQ